MLDMHPPGIFLFKSMQTQQQNFEISTTYNHLGQAWAKLH